MNKIFISSLIFVFVSVTKIEKLFNFESFNEVRDKLTNFVFKLKIKYEINANQYNSEETKLIYIYNLLRKNVQV